MRSSENSPRAVVIGLGYVGLTLSVALARRGIQVYGVEKRADVVEATNAGRPHFSEIGLDSALTSVVESGRLIASQTTEDIPPAEFYIITVGTPLKAGTHSPRLDMIEEASRQVAEHMPDGAAVILRSTVRIGTTRAIVKPVLDRGGKRYHLSMCPERTLEGDALRELATLPQIVGGISETASDLAAALFSRLTHTIVRVADPETAEMIKLVDNTSRDVRFAFANEVARACDAIGINANDVVRFGKLGYSRTDVALPGLVGGPCLEKDPHILLASVAPHDVTLEITQASRLVNERQPVETVDAVLAKLKQRRDGPFKVVVGGLAFKGKPETDDLRGSMSLHVVERLYASNDCAEIRAYDSVVSRDQLEALPYGLKVHGDFYEACDGADLVIIANNHPVFATIEIDRIAARLAEGGFIYDYWNNLAQHPAEILDGRYFTVGNLVGKY
ncbi:UDP-N-acetyl-D-mannosaminuronic acid dehydrogenase [Hephaestia caeni]|uniref:UDP-N-acetyl-D-mannosaminuronic acid dehydrogenase n=1 Tax=Hephaestia caeni TaxID=645617 RepID=A0A397ND26_9SPHN|nr:UDP-N-acetyl-D-mannosaminuronic acid dehydrogenase [Hephaestia caeni]